MPHVDLLDLPYFVGIPLDDAVSLVDLMEPRQFAPGAFLMREGDGPNVPLYMTISGVLRIDKSKHASSHSYMIAELQSPTLLGEIELFCHIPAVATAQAITQVSTFMLTRLSFEKLFIIRHPALAMFIFNVARVTCQRLVQADTQLSEQLAHTK